VQWINSHDILIESEEGLLILDDSTSELISLIDFRLENLCKVLNLFKLS